MGKRKKPAADDLFGDLFGDEGETEAVPATEIIPGGLGANGDSGTDAAVAPAGECPHGGKIRDAALGGDATCGCTNHPLVSEFGAPEVAIPDDPPLVFGAAALARLKFLLEGPHPTPRSIFDGGTKAPLTIFDIETIPLPWDEIEKVIPPFEEPLPFDPSSVKTGEFDKLKDQVAAEQKRRAKIAERRAAYETEAKGAKQKYVDEALKDATLNAMTCRVACIGYGCKGNCKGGAGNGGNGSTILLDGEQPESTADERTLLVNFWSHLLAVRNSQKRLVGIYIKTYDLPMLVQRSKFHGVRIPSGILRGKYYDDSLFTCLNEDWLAGMLNARTSDVKAIDVKWSKLNLLAKFLGVTMKTGELGAEFWFHWANDRAKAVEYAKGDIVSTLEVAQALQVVE